LAAKQGKEYVRAASVPALAANPSPTPFDLEAAAQAAGHQPPHVLPTNEQVGQQTADLWTSEGKGSMSALQIHNPLVVHMWIPVGAVMWCVWRLTRGRKARLSTDGMVAGAGVDIGVVGHKEGVGRLSIYGSTRGGQLARRGE